MAQEQSSTLLVHFEGSSPSVAEIKEALEKGDPRTKCEMMKKLIMLQLNGEPQNHLIMHVMKFCLPKADHDMKKLLVYFWECVDKTDGNGEVLPEIILICSALREDLQHPNEYVRGLTLRFLARVQEREILEQLCPIIINCLKDRVTYVKRNAVVCVHQICVKYPELIPNGPELIEQFLFGESDTSCKRHAFIMLFQCAQHKAVQYVLDHKDDIAESGELLQLTVVDHVKQLMVANPFERSKYLPIVFSSLHSRSPSVQFQCASTLLALSSSPTAIRQATSTFVQLLTTHTDNNVRLIVLERLAEIKKKNKPVLQESLLELLRGLSTTSNADVRRRILDFCLDLVNSKNAESFIVAMKKELTRSQAEAANEGGDQQQQQQQQARNDSVNANNGSNDENTASDDNNYQTTVIRAIHKTVMQHMNLAPAIVPIMIDNLCQVTTANDAAVFLRQVVHVRPDLRGDILTQLANLLQMIPSARVLRTVVWLLGVYAPDDKVLQTASAIREALLPLPFKAHQAASSSAGLNGNGADSGQQTVTMTTVREDGTYGVTVALVNKAAERERADLNGLRSQIINGDFFLAAATANTLAKLTVRAFAKEQHGKTALQSETTEILREFIRYGMDRASANPEAEIDEDCHSRIRVALTVAQNPRNDFLSSFVADTSAAFDAAGALMKSENKNKLKKEAIVVGTVAVGGAENGEDDDDENDVVVSVDESIGFSQLASTTNVFAGIDAPIDQIKSVDEESRKFLARLNRVVQLSGFSDSIYAEATITIHPFDVVLELYLVNQSEDMLNNVTVELAATGDLKLCERPQTFLMPPGSCVTTRASLKVSSTETGCIYGTIVFDSPKQDQQYIVLNEIRIDMMEYVKPQTCTANEFRQMWAEFDWENKVNVCTTALGTDLRGFAEQITQLTNMCELDIGGGATPDQIQASGFLSTSLYARSTFGEHVLANVSVELTDSGRVEGVIRIRSKQHGIALALGNRIKARCNQVV